MGLVALDHGPHFQVVRTTSFVAKDNDDDDGDDGVTMMGWGR